MIITINTKYFLKTYQHDFLWFIREAFSRMAAQQPRHTFIFFYTPAAGPFAGLAEKNMQFVKLPETNAGVFSGILYNLKIAGLLKRHRADVFINADGFCSLFAKTPQCFILADPVNFSGNELIKKNRLFFYKICMPFFIRKARVIVTDSRFSESYITRQYHPGKKAIDVVYKVSDSGEVVGWEEKEEIKARYAGGSEYFIFYNDASQLNILLNLLKAFSHFKKWQKSGMQVLIIEKNEFPVSFVENLTLFKYRQHVRLLSKLPPDELKKVTSAAYCMLIPSCERNSMGILRVINYNVPLITANTGPANELFGDTVLYADFTDPMSIAEKLALIFKDEKLRRELVESTSKRLQQYDWETTTALLWASIVKTSGQGH